MRMKLVSNQKKATILSIAVHNAARISRRPNIEGAHTSIGYTAGREGQRNYYIWNTAKRTEP